jgi:uncharacterized cupredoxin-like copper-binding protein
MKTILMIPVALVAAITFASAEEKKSDKTFGERASETYDKAKESTKNAGRAAVDTTKKAAGAVADAVTPDDAREVKVRLIEHKIEMPKQIGAGKTEFVVTNAGDEKHNFEIEGQGLEKKFFLNVGPNQTKTMKVDLKPGDYKVSCPVAGHEEHGMKLNLTVK